MLVIADSGPQGPIFFVFNVKLWAMGTRGRRWRCLAIVAFAARGRPFSSVILTSLNVHHPANLLTGTPHPGNSAWQLRPHFLLGYL